jgi:aspartate kinase
MRLSSALVLLLVPAWGFQPLRQPSSAGVTSSTQLLMSDEIKNYRKGLSEITRRDNSSKPHIDTVFKFGGSSLANAERVDYVAELIKDQIGQGIRPRAVVCSAMGKTTNNLLSAGEFALEGRVCVDSIRTLHEIAMDEFKLPEGTRQEVNDLLTECEQMLTGVKMIQELSPKSLDQLVSYGERCSVRILAARLNQIGVPAQAFDAWEVGILTDSDFGDAQLLKDHEGAVQKAFERIDPNVVAVVTGFIGHDPDGKITTLGRGGSDLTATAIGAALSLDEIQVWKDVDGILSTDPRVVPHAIPLDQVSFEEASELAYFGAQVLHPIAMQPAMKYNVPVRVKNSYNPSAIGTIIKQEKSPENRLVTAITYKRGITVLDICSTQMLGAYGFLARVFTEFEKHKLSVDVLASSEVSVSLTLDRKQDVSEVNRLIGDLQGVAAISRKDNMSILTLIADVDKSSEVLATVFRVFSTQGIKVEMMSQGASKVNISFILNSDKLEEAMLHLHSCFFEDMCVVKIDVNEKEEVSI